MDEERDIHDIGRGVEPHDVIEAVLRRSTGRYSYLHGVDHWKRVAAAGHALLRDTPTADPLIVFLFALFHDAMRLNDGHDPEHGPRAGLLVGELRDQLPAKITDNDVDTLVYACNEHTYGGTSKDPTVGVCWDADRLNLWRVDIRPDPLLLSTPAAKNPDRILWGRELQGQTFTWEDLWEGYGFVV